MNLVSCKKIVGNRYFVFVVLAIFFLIGLNIYSKDKFLMNIDERTSNTVSIVSGEVYQQPLLNVRQFETGAFIVSLKRNAETGFNGGVKFTLVDQDKVVQTWDVPVGVLSDLVPLHLTNPLKIDSSNNYKLQMQLYGDIKSVDVVGKTFGSNNTFTFAAYNQHNTKFRFYFLLSVSIFYLILIVLGRQHWNNFIIGVMLVFLGLEYICIYPMLIGPDETSHWIKAYEISKGQFFPLSFTKELGGYSFVPYTIFNPHINSAVIDSSNLITIEDANVAVYSFINYLPLVLGIKISSLFTDKVGIIYLTAKFINYAISVFFLYEALRILPFGKKMLLIIILNPITLQQLTIVSADGFTFSLSVYFIAYVLWCYKKEVINLKDKIVLTIVLLLLSQCKIIYVALMWILILLFKVDGKKLKSFIVILWGTTAIFSLTWLKIASSYLIPINKGANSGEQTNFIIHHFVDFLAIGYNTFISLSGNLVSQLFGSGLGTFNVLVNPIVWISFFIMFILSLKYNQPSINSERVFKNSTFASGVLVLVSMIVCFLIATSLYIQWTPLRSPLIEGLQGRYFIPSIILFGLALNFNSTDEEYDSSSLKNIIYFMIIVFLNNIALVDVITSLKITF